MTPGSLVMGPLPLGLFSSRAHDLVSPLQDGPTEGSPTLYVKSLVSFLRDYSLYFSLTPQEDEQGIKAHGQSDSDCMSIFLEISTSVLYILSLGRYFIFYIFTLVATQAHFISS